MRKNKNHHTAFRTQITTYARLVHPPLGGGAALVMPTALAERSAMDSQKSPEPGSYEGTRTWDRLPRGSDTLAPPYERRLRSR